MESRKMKKLILFILLIAGLRSSAQVGVAPADTSLRATVNGSGQVWKSQQYYRTAFGLYYNKQQSDARYAPLFAGGYIQNQYVSAQSGAEFRIDGRGYVGGNFVANGSITSNTFIGSTGGFGTNYWSISENTSYVVNRFSDNSAPSASGYNIKFRRNGLGNWEVGQESDIRANKFGGVWDFYSTTRVHVRPIDTADVVRLRDMNAANTAITQNIIRYTPIYSPTAGGTTLTISEFANTVPISIIRGNQEYKVSGTATETTVSVNTATGVVTTYYPFGTGETIYGVYQGVTPGAVITDGLGYTTVQNYTDIVTNPHWGGTAQWIFYVETDFQNMAGKKGAYLYVNPAKTPTPAQIAINFNDN